MTTRVMLTEEQAIVLSEKAQHSPFFASLETQYIRQGTLSYKQIDCIDKEIKRAAASDTAAPIAVGDITPIRAMFNAALVHLKKPRLTFNMDSAKIVISVAPDTGRNAGFLYVKADGEYFGKISPTGTMHTGRVAFSNWEDIQGDVDYICRDPQAAVLSIGKRTGTCCCCNRELTEAESIVSGVGPICAPRFGIERVGRQKALDLLAEQGQAAKDVVEGIAAQHEAKSGDAS